MDIYNYTTFTYLDTLSKDFIPQKEDILFYFFILLICLIIDFIYLFRKPKIEDLTLKSLFQKTKTLYFIVNILYLVSYIIVIVAIYLNLYRIPIDKYLITSLINFSLIKLLFQIIGLIYQNFKIFTIISIWVIEIALWLSFAQYFIWIHSDLTILIIASLNLFVLSISLIRFIFIIDEIESNPYKKQ